MKGIVWWVLFMRKLRTTGPRGQARERQRNTPVQRKRPRYGEKETDKKPRRERKERRTGTEKDGRERTGQTHRKLGDRVSRLLLFGLCFFVLVCFLSIWHKSQKRNFY